jgi:UDP-N-acetylglucosamine:LPS N-acetylglucosamine transferase
MTPVGGALYGGVVNPRPRCIAVLTAHVGEGHLAAARVLEQEVREAAPDVQVVLVDALEALGPLLRLVLLDAYRFQLRRTPRLFQGFFWLFQYVRPLRALGRASLSALGGRRLNARLEALAPDVIVSTYPAATSVLGTLRRRGRVTVPALATITDFAGLSFWSHPGIDLHLVMHPSLVRLVEREAGPGSACTVAPLAARAFSEAAGHRDAARATLGLPASGRVVVVSGGGWGVGDVAGAVAEAAALPETTVVAVAGHNRILETKLQAIHGGADHVRVLGFSDAMPLLLAAADVLVHTTGGVTCLEALTVGCPLVAYGAPPGHAPSLARAMAEHKIALHPLNRTELRKALLLPLPAPSLEKLDTAANRLLTARTRLQPTARRSPAAIALATAAVASLAFLLAGSRTAFAVIASPFELSPATVLPTQKNEVGLVIDVPPRAAPRIVRLLARRHTSATFAMANSPSPSLERLLTAHHDQTITLLERPGIDDWLGTADVVQDARNGRFALAPHGGISTGQYVLARLFGAHLIAPARQVERGAVVLWNSGSLERLLAAIAARGLRAAPLAALDAHPESASPRASDRLREHFGGGHLRRSAATARPLAADLRWERRRPLLPG